MAKNIEEEISKAFDKLTKGNKNVSFVFSYTYESSNGDKIEIEGRTGAYGSKEVVDILMDELEEMIEKNTKDDFVNV